MTIAPFATTTAHDCGRMSAPSRPLTMPSPLSTRPSGARARRSSAFAREEPCRRLDKPKIRAPLYAWVILVGGLTRLHNR
jgi:hypothetical protein